MRRPDINCFVAIAPISSNYEFNFISPCPTPGIFIQGGRDTVSNPADCYDLYKRLKIQKDSNIQYNLIDEANHIFINHRRELADIIIKFINCFVDKNFFLRNTNKKI